MSNINTPKTLWDLVETAKSVLTQQAQNELEKAVREKYGIGALAKARENITEWTRNELTSLVSWLPMGQEILMKLDPFLPGKVETLIEGFSGKNSPTDGLPVMSTEVKNITEGVVSEVENTKKSIFSEMKHSLGIDKESILSDLQKRAKGESIGIWGSIKLIIAGFLMKNEKISSWLGKIGFNITEWWSPEEMALAGIKKTEIKQEAIKPLNTEKSYNTTSLVLSEIANSEARKWNIAAIYALSWVKNIQLKEIPLLQSNIPLLRDRLGVGMDVSDEALRTFLKPFTKNSSLYNIFSGSYKKINPDKNIEDASLFNIISSAWSGIKTLSLMKKMDITDLSSSVEWLGESFIKVDGEDISGELVEQAEELWISKKVVKTLFRNRKWSFLKTESLETILRDPSLDESDKISIKRIRAFGIWFQEALINDKSLNLGNGDIMRTISQKWWINIGDILKSYILTGGKASLSEMSTTEKVGAYTSFFLIGWADPEWSGALTGSLINMENMIKLVQGESIFDRVPKDVQDIVKENFSLESTLKKVSQLAGGMWDSIAGFTKKSPGFASILTIAVLFLPVFAKRTNLVSILTGRK